MDSVNSTTFIKRPPCMTDTQEKQLYTKELLTGRIFMGCYQERRYVAALKEYRDVVIIHSEETELQNDIDKVRRKWLAVQNIKWVGITGPGSLDSPDAHCFWVKLKNLAFGQYWFQIKNVNEVEGEILLNLKCIRKSQSSQAAMGTSIIEKLLQQNKNESPAPPESILLSVNKVNWDLAKNAVAVVTEMCSDWMKVILPYLTVSNIFNVIKVACAFSLAIVMGTVTLIGSLGEYILRLIRELSILVNAFTPIIIHLIDVFGKIIGGLYILIAGMFGRNIHHVREPYHRTNDTYQMVLPPPADWRERNRILRQELLSSEFRRR